MWLITSDCCGAFCAVFCYFTVVFVYIGFIRIGIWEDVQDGKVSALLHFVVFQYHCFLIFWSHWKCMTTEPGLLPRNVDELDYQKLPKQLCKIIDQIGLRAKKLEAIIMNEKNKNKTQGMEIMDKEELLHLNQGAEMTESEDDYGDHHEHHHYRRRRDRISSSMQRSIDRLLGCSYDPSNGSRTQDGDGGVIDENGQITFDRRMYDFDTYQSILMKVRGFDYRNQKVMKNDLKLIEESFNAVSQTVVKILKKEEGKPKKMPTVDYNDTLTPMDISHVESIFQRQCKKCESLKVPSSHHCSTCGGCIARMDHHCPWVNNCVGFYNQKHFLLFLIYVFLGSAHALVLIIMQSYSCWNGECYIFEKNLEIGIAIIAMILALLFCIFVCVMFYDQLSCIMENTSTIDRLKLKRALKEGKRIDIELESNRSRTWWQNVCEVMSGHYEEGFNAGWLFPTDIQYEVSLENEYS